MPAIKLPYDKPGHIRATPVRNAATLGFVDLPAPFQVPAVGIIELEPTTEKWCWKLETVIYGVDETTEYVNVTTRDTIFNDLIRVDPGTFTPSNYHPEPAWWAALQTGLKGAAPGERGQDGKDGKNGRDGYDGRNGIDGRDGKDGVGTGVTDEAISPLLNTEGTATQLSVKKLATEIVKRGEANGTAPLDGAGLLPTNKLPTSVVQQSQMDSIGQMVNVLTSDPENAVSQFFVPATNFKLAQGAATEQTIVNRLHAWLLPSGSANYISTVLRAPSHWTKMAVSIIWVNTAANSGNISMAADRHEWAIGESINVTPTGGGSVNEANPAPWIASKSIIASATSPLSVNPSKTMILRVGRMGASVNDTLPNNIAILGVVLEKVA